MSARDTPPAEWWQPLLDRETGKTPRRLTPDEGRQTCGVDWTWTRPHFEEDPSDD